MKLPLIPGNPRINVPEEKTFHMSPDDFRRHGHVLVDWIADYYAHIESFPVLSRAEPGRIRASLPPHAPATGEPFNTMLHDVEKLILPGITHWQSPNFYAFFPCNSSGPAILGDLLSSGLGVQGMLWATSPACTELETHVLDWLVHMLALPEKFLSSNTGGGVIRTQPQAPRSVLWWLAASVPPTSPAIKKAVMGALSPTLPLRRILRLKKLPRLLASVATTCG